MHQQFSDKTKYLLIYATPNHPKDETFPHNLIAVTRPSLSDLIPSQIRTDPVMISKHAKHHHAHPPPQHDGKVSQG